MKKKNKWSSAARFAAAALTKFADSNSKNYDATCAYMAALEDEIRRKELKAEKGDDSTSGTDSRQEYISKRFNEIKSQNLKFEELEKEKKHLEKRYSEAGK